MRIALTVLGAVSGFALLGALVAGQAQAGVVITTEQGAMPNQEAGQVSTMFIDADRIKMNAGRGQMIYRGDLSKVWMMDEASKAYREMTPDSMKAMKAQMTSAMARMQKELAAMPAEQREQVQKMMAQRGMPMPSADGSTPPAPKIGYEKTGAPKTVKSWMCQPYKMTINGKPETEQCIAKLSDVGLTRDDFKAFVSFATFMSALTSGTGGAPAGAFDFDTMSKAIGYDGVPVQTTHYADDGKIDFQTTVRSIDHKAIPTAEFEVPADYKKQDMPVAKPPAD